MTAPRRPEHANKCEHVGNGYMIERRLMGYCYPRNGNVHNATPQYHWVLYLNGKQVDSDPRRTPLRRAARRDDYR